MTEKINAGDRIRLTSDTEVHEFVVHTAAVGWVDSEYNSFNLGDFTVEILDRKPITVKEFFESLEISAQFTDKNETHRFVKTGEASAVRLASRDQKLKYYPNVFEAGAFSHWIDSPNNFVIA